MIYRMCWNSRGWRMPTHTSGDGGYPREMGFGMEEWNFQLEDAVDGFVYGYLYYKPSAKVVRESAGRFRIGFWSMHPDTRAKLLVGVYNDASQATPEDLLAVDSTFEKNGVYPRRAEELSSVVPSISFDDALSKVRNSVHAGLLNFKCRVEDFHLPPEPIPIGEIVRNQTIGEHFTTPTFIPELNLPGVRRRPATAGAASVLAEDAYYRENPQTLKRIIRRHNTLSTRFGQWLKRSGFSGVMQERNYVDVTFEKDDAHYRAELKTCYGVGSTKAIREALGQLLEYNLYPGKGSADRWAIIIDERPSKHDIEYLLVLRRQLKLPLCLGWKERDGFVFPDGLGL